MRRGKLDPQLPRGNCVGLPFSWSSRVDVNRDATAQGRSARSIRSGEVPWRGSSIRRTAFSSTPSDAAKATRVRPLSRKAIARAALAAIPGGTGTPRSPGWLGLGTGKWVAVVDAPRQRLRQRVGGRGQRTGGVRAGRQALREIPKADYDFARRRPAKVRGIDELHAILLWAS